MFDPKVLLDQVLSGGARAPGGSGQQPGATGGGGGLQDILGQVLNRGGGQGGTAGGGLQDILGQVLNRGGGGGAGGGLGNLGGLLGGGGGGMGGMGGGALAGGLLAILMGSKGGRKIGQSALKIGGLALLGGLAYKAYSDWQSGAKPGQSALQAGDPAELSPPQSSPFAEPASPARADKSSDVLLRAMIAAARADGHIDAQEQAALKQVFEQGGEDRDVQAFLFDALGRADDLDALAADVDTPEFAAEVYLAARVVAEPDTRAERDFLARLAQKLGLEAGFVEHLEATITAAKNDQA